nr:hypothetical protein [Tanacetum cinerariifolium]
HVADEAVYKELGDSLVRVVTTASSLKEQQDSGNIAKTQSKETPNESSSQGTDLGGGPRCQEAMGDTTAQTRITKMRYLSDLSCRIPSKLKIVGNKMHKAFRLPVIKFPLTEEVPTASEESFYCQKKREATAVKIALLLTSRRNCQSKSDDSYAKLVPHITP